MAIILNLRIIYCKKFCIRRGFVDFLFVGTIVNFPNVQTEVIFMQ